MFESVCILPPMCVLHCNPPYTPPAHGYVPPTPPCVSPTPCVPPTPQYVLPKPPCSPAVPHYVNPTPCVPPVPRHVPPAPQYVPPTPSFSPQVPRYVNMTPLIVPPTPQYVPSTPPCIPPLHQYVPTTAPYVNPTPPCIPPIPSYVTPTPPSIPSAPPYVPQTSQYVPLQPSYIPQNYLEIAPSTSRTNNTTDEYYTEESDDDSMDSYESDTHDEGLVLRVKSAYRNGFHPIPIPHVLFRRHFHRKISKQNALKVSINRPGNLTENTVFENPGKLIECRLVGSNMLSDDESEIFLVSPKPLKTYHCYYCNRNRVWKANDLGYRWAIFKDRCQNYHFANKCLNYDEVDFMDFIY